MYATKGKGKDIYIRKMSRDGHGSRKLFCKCAKTAQTQRIAGELGRHIYMMRLYVLVVVLYRTHVEFYNEFFFFKSNSSVSHFLSSERRGGTERKEHEVLRLLENLKHTH